MTKKIVNNILFSGVEQFILIISQFISSFVIIRNLPREDYGILGVIAGYYVFFNFFNITAESIILRDHEKFKDNITNVLRNFSAFSILKIVLIFILSLILAFLLFFFYHKVEVFYAVGISFFVLSGQALVSPFVIYYSAKYNQKLVTKITSLKTFIRLIALCGLFYYNNLYYYFLVELVVNIIYCFFWYLKAYKKLELNFFTIFFFNRVDWKFIKISIAGYSIWTHLNGIITSFVYRSDTIFLSFFVGLAEIGNYNISLNSANIANIIPSILGYQNSVALSNISENEEIQKTTNGFIKISFYIGLFTFFGFVIFGIPFLQLITGQRDVIEMYYYMLLIVLSLIIIKTISSPLVALINIKGNVKGFFSRVSLPLFLFVILSYTLSASIYGLIGVAFANVINAIFWLLLVIKEFKKYNYKISLKINLRFDYLQLKNFIKN